MGFRRSFAISFGLSLAATGVVVALTRRRDQLAATRHALRTSSSPGAHWYEAVFGRLLAGFYDDVALEVEGVLAGLPGGGAPRVLEIGPGPGMLARRVAARLPAVEYTGVDIDGAMVARATAAADESGFAGRVRFVEGDVAALPFEDASFDLVVSTFSVHHWPDAEAGFREVRRVLRPDGEVVIIDLPDAWRHVEGEGGTLAGAAAAGFPGATVTPFRWPGRVPLGRRLVLAAMGAE